MKRKRRQPGRARNERAVPQAPRAPAVGHGSVQDTLPGSGASISSKSQDGVGGTVLVVAAVLLFAVCTVVGWILRWRSPPGTWPSSQDVGLSIGWAAVAAGTLVLSSFALEWARRLFRQRALTAARLSLAAVLMLGGMALMLRVQEHWALHTNGITLWRARNAVFNDADVYYVHAVKERLKQLYRQLDDKQTNRPDIFRDADRQQLELVATLQFSMVGWTEQEVGHWLDDPQQRRAVMEVMAYMIHPVARQRGSTRERVEMETEELNRRRQWLVVLRDFCQRKLAMFQRRKEDRPPTGTASNDRVGVPDESESSRELANQVREKLKRLGGGDWAFAHAVLQDAVDSVMAGERLNQISMALSNMDARAAFVREFLDPLCADPTAPGLNRRFSFLQLPVSFPQARGWVGGYALITLWHSLLLASGLVAVLRRLCRSRASHSESLSSPLRWFWHATVVMGLLIFVTLYCF
jgi:heme/copper-type cytochrome/quinol oxidase subunit 3